MSKYEIKYTTQFKKDYKLAKRRGLDIEVLVLTLARTGKIGRASCRERV